MPVKPSEVFETHRSSVRRVVEAHQARNPRVFGSIARGEDTTNSDLDLLVDTTEGTSLFDIAAIELELERLMGTPVHVTTASALHGALRVRVLRKPNPYEWKGTTDDRVPGPHVEVRRINAYADGLDHRGFDADTAPGFVAAHSEVPWALAYRMRNALSHGYADIDLGTVWSTVQRTLSQLERQSMALEGRP
jgi:predicted nucleotidyltransferase